MSRAPKVCAIRKPCSISAFDCSFGWMAPSGPSCAISGPSSWSAPMPSLFAIPFLRLANGAAGIGTDELEDIFNRADATKALGRFVHPIAQRAVGGEQKLVGVA